jgi:rhodanese-related sulfurtransferase
MPTEAVRRSAEVSWEEVRRRLGEKGLAIVDVLPEASHQSGHIPGAISLPLAELREKSPEVLPDRKQEIIVYCGSFT